MSECRVIKKNQKWNKLVLVVTAGRLPTNLTSAFIVGYLTYQAGLIGYLYTKKKGFRSVCNVTEGTKYVALTTLTLRKERGCNIYPKFLVPVC